MAETVFSKILSGEIPTLKFMKMTLFMHFRYFTSD